MMGLGTLTLNIMTLGGLALGVGLLIDNSIVMLENIFRHRPQGNDDPEEAAHRGSAEVTERGGRVHGDEPRRRGAVPPDQRTRGAHLQGADAHHLLRDPGVAGNRAHRGPDARGAFSARCSGRADWSARVSIRAFDGGLERFRSWYRIVAGAAVRRRGWVLVGAFATLGLVPLLLRGLGNEFLPAVDDGNVSVYMRLPPGTAPLRRRTSWPCDVEAMVGEMPHVRHVFATAGGSLFGSGTARAQRAWLRRCPAGPGAAAARHAGRTLGARRSSGASTRSRSPAPASSCDRRGIRGLRTNASGSDVAIDIQGDDLAVLQRIGLEVLRPGARDSRPRDGGALRRGGEPAARHRARPRARRLPGV